MAFDAVFDPIESSPNRRKNFAVPQDPRAGWSRNVRKVAHQILNANARVDTSHMARSAMSTRSSKSSVRKKMRETLEDNL